MLHTAKISKMFALLLAIFLIGACKKSGEAKMESSETAQSGGVETVAVQDSDRAIVKANFGSAEISIDYGRPQLKGRDMLSMATEGMVWRMGMNEATEISTSADLKFGETVIPRGQYSLWMRKGAGESWELLFNEKTGIWGAPTPEGGVIAATPMKAEDNSESVERFTIELQKIDDTTGRIKASWGNKLISAEFRVQPAG